MKHGRIAAATLAAGVVAAVLTGCRDDGPAAPTAAGTPSPAITSPTPTGATRGSRPTAPPGETVRLAARNFTFSPREFRITNGRTATIVLTNNGNTLHNFRTLDLRVDQDVAPGKTVQFPLVGRAAGTFDFVCKYHTARNMRGYVTIR